MEPCLSGERVSAKVGPYGRIARFVLDHRKLVSLIAAAVTVLSILVGLPPEIEPNLLELLPERDPSVIALRQLHEEEGGTNLVTLAFAADDDIDLEPVLDELAAELEALESIRYAIHGVDEDFATSIGLLQLEPKEIKELTGRMKGALALGPALNPIVTQKLMDMGPITEKVGKLTSTDPVAVLGGGRLLVRPTGSSHDPDFSVALIDAIEALVEAAEARHPGVRLAWMGGAYRHNVEDLRGIQQDLLWTSLASMFLVLSVIVIAFRSMRAMFFVLVPLGVANVVNLALVWVFLGHLNTYTAFSTALLIGLGIDFAVHLVGRYRELRADMDVEEAIVTAWDRTGPPCMTAALTSAAGFLALAAADFQGFSQLGVLLAVGLMTCLLSMLILLPVLLPIFDREPSTLIGTRRVFHGRSTYALAPVGLMIAVLATGTVAAGRLPALQWEFDFSALRRDGLAYDELSNEEKRLAKASYSPVVVSYPSRHALSLAQGHVKARIADGTLPHVSRALSIVDVLPPDQTLRVEALQELIDLLDHKSMRYLPPPLVEPLLPLRGQQLQVRSLDDLPYALRDLLGARSAEHHRLLLFPKGNMWDLREAAMLGDELRNALGAEHPAAGEYVTLGALYRTVRRDMPIVGVLALLMVGILTWIDLGKPHLVAGAIGTLIAGMAWAGSAVQAVDIKLSIMNIVGVPILLGIGVDVVIHLLHRLEEEGPGGVRRALMTTGVAASISTLTTVLSFSSLTLAGNRGVRSLGMLVVIGLIAVFVASATLLPLAWAAGWKVTGQAPADAPPPKS
jgi:uncharacterized protein